MKDRIRQLMLHQHMSQQTFADILGLSPASLSSIFNDRTKPTLNHVDAIKKKFPSINLDWLMYGNGSMFLDDSSQNDDMFANEGEHFETANSDASTAKTATPTLDFDNSPSYSGVNYNASKERVVIKEVEKPQRQITEIRIFFDDQTWETFVPKK